jgi:hypothetical protein
VAGWVRGWRLLRCCIASCMGLLAACAHGGFFAEQGPPVVPCAQYEINSSTDLYSCTVVPEFS